MNKNRPKNPYIPERSMKSRHRKLFRLALSADICMMLLTGTAACGNQVEVVQIETGKDQSTVQQDGDIPSGVDGVDAETMANEALSGGSGTNEADVLASVPDEVVQNGLVKLAEAQERAGFSPVTLPAVTGYGFAGVNILPREDGSCLLEVNYKWAGSSERRFYTRKAAGTGDISGLTGTEYTPKDINGHIVEVGEVQGKQVAVWENGESTYSAVGSGMEPDAFYSLVGVCLEQ